MLGTGAPKFEIWEDAGYLTGFAATQQSYHFKVSSCNWFQNSII